ncbi:MAG TPA: hypothetical protein VH277_15710 [Gemmatimonadaceae bacterium]|nr:hypothetical protein [Gemmatimonadaceae bacterium]
MDIAPGHIGALRLDTTLGAIQRECPDYGWTTIHGDERLDTAILITRPGLRVAGSLAIIDDEGGERHPTIDSAMRVQYWEVTGTNARLPKGVPIDGTWDDLRRAFGEVRAEALNGEITVFVCGLRDIQIQMAVPNPGTDPPINPVDGAVPSQLVLDSLLGKLRIERVFLASPSHAPRYRGGCA